MKTRDNRTNDTQRPELTRVHSFFFAIRIKPLICFQKAKLPAAQTLYATGSLIYSARIPKISNKHHVLSLAYSDKMLRKQTKIHLPVT